MERCPLVVQIKVIFRRLDMDFRGVHVALFTLDTWRNKLLGKPGNQLALSTRSLEWLVLLKRNCSGLEDSIIFNPLTGTCRQSYEDLDSNKQKGVSHRFPTTSDHFGGVSWDPASPPWAPPQCPPRLAQIGRCEPHTGPFWTQIRVLGGWEPFWCIWGNLTMEARIDLARLRP